MAKKRERVYNIIKKTECDLEFLVVSKTKLKIILDKDEVEKYRLSDFSSGESGELRRRLGEILEVARERVGFDAGGDRLLVSYYPTRLSGAELFVTALSTGGEVTEPVYYIFESLRDISSACRAIAGRAAESRAYLLAGEQYCLEVAYARGGIDILSEFSEPIEKRQAAYMLEHSRLLLDADAVSVFARL